jgi:hypothetical protein
MNILLFFFLTVHSSLLLSGTSAWCHTKRCKELGVCADVYQHSDFKGRSKCVYPLGHEWKTACSNLPEWWQDYGSPTARVSSVKTRGKCVKLWSELNCTGEVLEVRQTTSNLSALAFNDKTRSVSTCLRKDEVSGASNKSCTDIRLFYENELPLQKKKNLVSDIATKMKDGSKFLIIATPFTVFYPVIDAMHLLVTISNDIMNLNLTQQDLLIAGIDIRITKQSAYEAETEIRHWLDELELMVNSNATINSTTGRSTISHTYHAMSIILNSLKGGAFMGNPLVSSPFLAFFAMVFYPILQVQLLFEPQRKNKICRQGAELEELLDMYQCNSTRARINLISETIYVNAVDYLTHEQVFKGASYASVSEMFRLKPILNVCHRDWIISIVNRMNDFFLPSRFLAKFSMKNLLNCSAESEDDDLGNKKEERLNKGRDYFAECTGFSYVDYHHYKIVDNSSYGHESWAKTNE